MVVALEERAFGDAGGSQVRQVAATDQMTLGRRTAVEPVPQNRAVERGADAKAGNLAQ